MSGLVTSAVTRQNVTVAQGCGSALIECGPDTDPDPAFFLIADSDRDPDPHPVPDPGIYDQNLEKIYSWKFFLYQKLQFTGTYP